MRRVRIGIIGAGAATEWALLPALSGPDALTPPDSGAWWGRRPSAHAEIHYQPPVQPEVVALCDGEMQRARRVGEAARVRAIYSDWRQMLREVPLDAIFCAAGPDVAAEVVLAMRGALGPRHLWVDGPPAPTAQAAGDLEKLLAPASGHGLQLWCARPLRQAAAHRAAWRLLQRETLGPVAGLSLRWGAGLFRPREVKSGLKESSIANGHNARLLSRDDVLALSSSYAAIDVLLGFAAPAKPGREEINHQPLAAPVALLASERAGVATLWLHFADGASALALFAPAENWNSPLPRLEICGTEGRSIVCEGGRRLWLHEPREAARFWEPPGLAVQISAANLVGIVEDVKAFLANCVAETHKAEPASGPSPLESAIRTLRVMEAAAQSLNSGRVVEIEPSGPHPSSRREDTEEVLAETPVTMGQGAQEAPETGTLPLFFE
ncbi:MAG TPA: hypothetical protein VGB77_01655 [Abditibacteriaceae bacterium]